MFRNTAGFANKIARSFSERQYHMFSKRQLPTQNVFVLQVGQTPGASPAMGNGLMCNHPGYVPSKLFTTAFIKKNPAVFPIIALMGMWAVGVTGYCVYAVMTRDAEYTRNSKHQHDRIDLRNPHSLKMYNIHEAYVPNEELADLLDDINKAEKGNK